MPGILTTAEINAMAATVYNYVLPDTCNILDQTEVSDGAGGWTNGTAIVSGGSAIACRFDTVLPPTARETVGGAEGLTIDGIFTWGTAAPVAIDRLVEYQGTFYQIREFLKDASWLLCRRANVTRIE